MSTATLPAPVGPPISVTGQTFHTVAELMHHLGDIPADRVRMWPLPGTAVEDDVFRVRATEGVLCELIDGILVEKPMGLPESRLASTLGHFIESYLDSNNIGMTAGADATLRLNPDRLRLPDLCFINWDRLPNRECPREQVPLVAPDLAVEVRSPRNTRAELARKRREYFAAGTRLVWEVEPDDRLVRVYTDADTFTTVDENGTLDGGAVLPGFTLSVRRWFERANRGG
jgi:Uma2 family endonuclease